MPSRPVCLKGTTGFSPSKADPSEPPVIPVTRSDIRDLCTFHNSLVGHSIRSVPKFWINRLSPFIVGGMTRSVSHRPRGTNATDSVVFPLAVSPSLRPSKVSFAPPPSSLSPCVDSTHESASRSISPPSSSSSSSLPTAAARSASASRPPPSLWRSSPPLHPPPTLPPHTATLPVSSTSLLHLSSHFHRCSPSPFPCRTCHWLYPVRSAHCLHPLHHRLWQRR